MAEDPRKFTKGDPKSCPPGEAQARKSGFFESLGKIGDLEVLNNVNNDIGQGLRTLETVSEQIRTGKGFPKAFETGINSIEAGADTVMGFVGINANTARGIAGSFNPAVANRAFGTAEQIYDRVQQGNYEVRDIPEAIQDLGALSQLTQGIFTTKPGEVKRAFSCNPSPYAVDLITRAPKSKFMFVVEFIFNGKYAESEYFRDFQKGFAFMVKRSTRPNINFEYEDINYYNFRTKVLKKSEYQPMQMTFYDDISGDVLRFFRKYLQIISPISRSVGDGTSQLFEESGMTWDQGSNFSASINAVGDTVKTIIDYVNLYHISNQTVKGNSLVDVYRFDNPRLQVMTLDELDMADGGSGNEITIEFNYDGLNILNAQDIQDPGANVKELTDVGVYSLGPDARPAAPTTTQPSTTGVTQTVDASQVQESKTKLDDEVAATAVPGPAPFDQCAAVENDLAHFRKELSLNEQGVVNVDKVGPGGIFIALSEAEKRRLNRDIQRREARKVELGCK